MSIETPTYNRSNLLEMLHSREVFVKFKKVNGVIRNMRCTLKFDLLPTEVQNHLIANPTDPDEPINESVIAVYDLEAQGWRSFRLDGIIEVL
jgi:hypothetical protein